MKHEKLYDAFDQISDAYIAETAQPKKRSFPWMRTIAAVTALAILGVGLWRFWPNSQPNLAQVYTPNETKPPVNIPSGAHISYLAAEPVYPQVVAYPLDDGRDYDQWESWKNCQDLLHNQPKGYADSLDAYFTKLIPTLLTDTSGQNIVCSPVNIYMALAMLAQTTDGASREQILSLLGSQSVESLCEQAQNVWLGHYNDDGLTTSILGNSLWLDDSCGYHEETVQLLAQKYYASVFRGDLGSETMDRALQSWLSEQTGGLLDETIQNVRFDPRTVLALASTIYYQVPWVSDFPEHNNFQGTFHGASGDREVTYMKTTMSFGPYYWGEDFAAVSLNLEGGDQMWLILPDKGLTPEDILKSGHAMQFVLDDPYQYPDKKDIRVHLTVPKFDVDANLELKEQLQKLGVTDVFESGKADFSPILSTEDGGYVSGVQHATRVAIDEEGVTAAAFTLILRCGAGIPPGEEVDFTLDCPFLFVIESNDGLPLFTGVVNQP